MTTATIEYEEPIEEEGLYDQVVSATIAARTRTFSSPMEAMIFQLMERASHGYYELSYYTYGYQLYYNGKWATPEEYKEVPDKLRAEGFRIVSSGTAYTLIQWGDEGKAHVQNQ